MSLALVSVLFLKEFLAYSEIDFSFYGIYFIYDQTSVIRKYSENCSELNFLLKRLNFLHFRLNDYISCSTSGAFLAPSCSVQVHFLLHYGSIYGLFSMSYSELEHFLAFLAHFYRFLLATIFFCRTLEPLFSVVSALDARHPSLCTCSMEPSF